jgi:hypothetical protein
MKSGISVTTVVQGGKTTTVTHSREFSDAEIEDALRQEASFLAHLCLLRPMYPGSIFPSNSPQLLEPPKPPGYIIPGPGGSGTF